MTIRVLSLGAGVQSTTVALMAAYGDIPPIEHAVFANTGWEPPSVYEHFIRLRGELEKYGVAVHEVNNGNLYQDSIDPQRPNLFVQNPKKYPEMKGKQRTFLPVFVVTDDKSERYLGEDPDDVGDETSVPLRYGMARRTCTGTYKIVPVERKLREILGLKKNARWPKDPAITQLFGISSDESQRMRDSPRSALIYDYPLVDMGMTRDDCHTWLRDHGWTAPRSACIGCPFHSDEEWRNIRDNHPEDWENAVDFDKRFRERAESGLMMLRSTPFLHRSCLPLDRAPIDSESPGFDESCEGFCGT